MITFPCRCALFRTRSRWVWYGSSSTTGSAWAGEHGLHFTSNGPTAKAKENIDAYRQAFAAHGKPAHPKPEFPGGLAVGTLRHIVVAETDEEALKIAAPSIEYHCRHLNWLRKRHGQTEFTNSLGIHREEDFGSWQRVGMAIAGSPETVAAELEAQIGALGINYLIAYLFFGTMTAAEAGRSLELYASEVMPRLAAL